VERLRWLFPQAGEIAGEELYRGTMELVTEGQAPIRRLTATYQELRGTPVDANTEEPDGDDEGPDARTSPPSEAGSSVRRGARMDILVRPNGEIFEAGRSFTLWEGERFVFREPAELDLPSAFITPYDHWFRALPAQRFSDAKRGGFEAEIVDLLQRLDERIVGIDVLTSSSTAPRLANEAALYLRDRTAGLLPIESFGDGFRRVLLMALAVPRAAGGALFIDEIETAIHVTALSTVFRWMVAACRQHDVQLFLTTHSLEALDAILRADAAPGEEDIVGYRLERDGAETHARRFGEGLLKRLRFERGLEVR
jgi:hypothetical protein